MNDPISKKSVPISAKQAEKIRENQCNDFPDRALYHTKMITGAFALLSAVEPEELSKDDLYDFCFGLMQMNERFTEELRDYLKAKTPPG